MVTACFRQLAACEHLKVVKRGLTAAGAEPNGDAVGVSEIKKVGPPGQAGRAAHDDPLQRRSETRAGAGILQERLPSRAEASDPAAARRRARRVRTKPNMRKSFYLRPTGFRSAFFVQSSFSMISSA